jgi:hypothetical protein
MIFGRTAGADLLLASVLAAASACVTWSDARLLARGGHAFYESDDLWFESDTLNHESSMVSRQSPDIVNSKHPLFALLTLPPTTLLTSLGVPRLEAVQAVLAAAAAAWMAVYFVLLRLIGCGLVDAAIFSLLAKGSAASMFLGAVPEAFNFGSITILAPLLLVALDRERRIGRAWYIAASVFSATMSISNWLAGLLATLARWPRRHARDITLRAAGVLAGLLIVQKLVVPHAPVGVHVWRTYIMSEAAGSFSDKTRALLVHSMVMPEIQRTSKVDVVTRRPTPLLSVQRARIGSGAPWALAASILWMALLAAAALVALGGGAGGMVPAIAWMLVGAQLALHLVYGDETFLFSFHTVPLLVLLVASAGRGSRRMAFTAAAAVLSVAVWTNNRRQFADAALMVWTAVGGS